MYILLITGVILLSVLVPCYKFLHTIYGSMQLFIVLQLTYFVLFLKCINKMVDIISNKIYETYCRFSPSNTQPKDSLVSLTALKRFSNDQRRRKERSRETDSKLKDAHLFHIKTNPPEVFILRKRPLMGSCCLNCTNISRGSYIKKSNENLMLRDILRYEIPVSKNGILSKIFSHLYQVFELKQYEYPQVAHLVLKEDRVKKAIEKSSLQQFRDSEFSEDDYYQWLIKSNQKRAKKLINDMKSKLSDFLLRFTSWILYKLLPCFLNSVVVHPGQVEMLKEASKSNLPLIFLPLHRSHLDYILISFILLNNNIRAPLVAAGDNLRIPFFGSLLRGLGAFFIKRRIDPVKGRKDYVYKAVLHTYMNLCLKQGHNIEFFLEGGRTRTGKPLMPKYGILSVIVDSFMDGTIDDALIVPVSVNYEKLVDGNFVHEQLGESKKMETFSSTIKGIWHVLNSNYGMMRIDFNQPFSLKELIATFNANKKSISKNFKRVLKSNPSTNSLYGTDIVSDEHKTLVENISKHVIYDCGQSTSIMSTNALAFLLLTKFRDGISLEKLVVALDDLIEELNYRGRDVGFIGDSLDVINYAIDILGPALIKREKQKQGHDLISPVSILPNVIELAYYSNIVVTHFALESVISLALSVTEITLDSLLYDDLIENVMELCDIFQYEFLFCKPCQSLDEVVIAAIDDLAVRKGFFVQEQQSVLVQKSLKLANQFDADNADDDDENGRENNFQNLYKLNMSAESLNNIRYLRSILMPLIETYAITAFTLDKLVQRQLLESELINEVLIEMKGQLERKSIKYDESIGVDSIKNAIKLYQKWDVLECHNEDKLRIYYLKDTYDDSETIAQVYTRINKFRQFTLD